MHLSKELIEILLNQYPIAIMATHGQNQLIHQVPIVFVRQDGVFWSPIDGKPKSASVLARVNNLQSNPNVSLLLEDYQQDWSQLWWIRIDGIGNVVRPDPDNEGQISVVLNTLYAKYPQYQGTAVLREPATLLSIKPNRIVDWCADLSAVQARVRQKLNIG